MSHLSLNDDYKILLVSLKNKIKQSQIKASLAINTELIELYWELGRNIVEKQTNSEWGSGFIEQLSKDLKTGFPEIGGFSKRNLEIVRQWYLFYSSIAKQLVSQLNLIPWGHHILIIQKIKMVSEATFYIQKTIENNWRIHFLFPITSKSTLDVIPFSSTNINLCFPIDGFNAN